jgi:hypothetical protein
MGRGRCGFRGFRGRRTNTLYISIQGPARSDKVEVVLSSIAVDHMARIKFDEWIIENLRLTVFPAVESTVRPTDWWRHITSVDPDQVSTSGKRGVSSAEGIFKGTKLVLRSALDRIDWFLVPTDSATEDAVLNSEPPAIGHAAEAFELFSSIVEKWLSSADLPTINRIAFGGTLTNPVGDRRSAYLSLREYIPVEIDPDSSDLLYQVNLPHIESPSVPGLEFNRLSKWLVTHHEFFAVPIGGVLGTPIAQGSGPVSIRLELDINTMPTFKGPIPRAKLSTVCNELVGAARNIISNGLVTHETK